MNEITVNTWHEIPKNYTGRIKYKKGTQAWYKNGERHREDGPAVIWPSGTEFWCLNDKYYTKESYYKELYKRKLITEHELFIELL